MSLMKTIIIDNAFKFNKKYLLEELCFPEFKLYIYLYLNQ